jgi:hypothetical protein
MHESQPINVDSDTSDEQSACIALMVTAEREFVAFTRAGQVVGRRLAKRGGIKALLTWTYDSCVAAGDRRGLGAPDNTNGCRFTGFG